MGDDVEVYEESTKEEIRYVFATEDSGQMRRVDLVNGDAPVHQAFPEMELYDKPYIWNWTGRKSLFPMHPGRKKIMKS